VWPTTYFDEDEQTTFWGNGVEAHLVFDNYGRLVRVRAYWGRIVRGYPNLPPCPDTRLRLQPYNDSDHRLLRAPPAWRGMIEAFISGVHASMLGPAFASEEERRLALLANTADVIPPATLAIEHYHIQRLDHPGHPDLPWCNGVECYVTRDSLGRVLSSSAYLGRVVWQYGDRPVTNEPIRMVYPLASASGAFVAAPLDWRERVLESLLPPAPSWGDVTQPL